MTDLAITNTLSDGNSVLAAEHNTNYTTDIATFLNNRNSASASWDSFRTAVSTAAPLIADNSSGTSNLNEFQDNGTVVHKIADGGVPTFAFQPAVQVTLSGNQAPSGLTKIAFDTETFDVKSEFDTTNYKYTATKAGKYLVFATAELGVNTFTATMYIYKNGSSVFSSTATLVAPVGTTGETMIVQEVIELAASDYLEVYVDGPAAVFAAGSFLSIFKVA